MSQKTKVNKFLAGAVTATMVATAVVPTAALAAKPSEGFSDVGHLAPETLAELDRVVELGLMTGFGNAGLFKPETYMNRGQVAKALAKYEAGKSGMSIAQYYHALKLDGKVQPFADVPKNSSDQELYQASLIVKNAGTFKGVSNKLNPDSNITRGHMASVLVRAFDLKATGKATDFADKGDADTEEIATNMQILKDNGVAKELSDNKFNPNQNVKRIQMASFLLRAYDVENPEAPAGSGITSVKAINDTTIEVTFGKALDKDVAREIEDDKERFVIYNGGQTPNTKDVIKSEFVSFNSDYTKATIDLNKTPETDISYTVALMDGKKHETAEVMYKSNPIVLKEGAEQPSITVNADQDKIILDFKTKMKSNVVEKADEIYVYDNNDKRVTVDGQNATLANITDGDVKWEDSTKRQKLESKLKPGVLEAGKTYKFKIQEESGIETNDGDKLSDTKRTITVKTPSIDKAAPKANFARVTGENEIQVNFDKDLADVNVNTKLVTVKTATGKELDISEVKVEDGTKVVTITLKDNELKDNQTYKVDFQANVVANNIFQNAMNKAQNNVEAKAQASVAIASMSAKFERQSDNKDKADLLLTFDQRPELDSIKDLGENLFIEEGGKTYKFQGGEVEYVGDGKTVRIKDVTNTDDKVFDNGFKLESNKSYTVKIKRDSVKTDSFKDDITNNVELKAVISGIDVTAPEIDNVTFESESKMVVEFDKEIESIKPEDIYVLGYKLNRSGDFTGPVALTDKNHLNVSVSGKKLTVTAKDSDIKFVTGSITSQEVSANSLKANEFFKLKANKLKGKNEVEAGEQVLEFNDNKVKLTGSVTNDDLDYYDNAAPVIVGATVTDNSELELTYSENVEFKDAADAGRQFSFKNAETKNYGTPAAAVESDSNIVKINFYKDGEKITTDDVLEVKAYSDLEITYKRNSSYELRDGNGNSAKGQTVKGAKTGNAESNANPSKPTDEEKETESVDKKLLTEAITKAKASDYKDVASVKAAIAKAEAVNKDKESTKDQVKNATEQLNNAVKEATEKAAEKVKAEEAVTEAEAELENAKKAVTEAETELENAKKAVTDAGEAATEEQKKAVTEAEAKLENAKKAVTEAEAKLENAKKDLEALKA